MASSKNLEQTVRKIACTFPEVQEGIVCNRVSFEAGKKRFLFLETKEDSCLVLLKLDDSLAEAEKLAKARPQCYCVGGSNWVTATFTAGQLPPPGLLERWIVESYRLLVPKRLTTPSKTAAKKPKPKSQSKRKASR